MSAQVSQRRMPQVAQRSTAVDCTSSAPDAPTTAERRGLVWYAMLPVLTLVSISLRLWGVSRVELIARDGYYYCTVARKINDGLWLTAAGDWFAFNPFPALIALLQRSTGISYELAGQLMCAVPAGLTVLPLYFWIRSAYSRRIATIAGWCYVIHPILIRTSSDVMREGLYWFLMVTGVWLFWEAVQRSSLVWYCLAGVIGTAAVLTRIEAIAIFALAVAWTVAQVRPVPQPWRTRVWRLQGVCAACLTFPLTILMLNVCLMPPDQPWRGMGRFQHLVNIVLNRQPSASDATDEHGRESKIIQASHKSMSGQDVVIPQSVRGLAKSLPVWQTDGTADETQYRLQRFLILADDHREAIYFSHFINRSFQGLLYPMLIFLAIGLLQARDQWVGTRDWPLTAMAGLLIGFMFLHLSTEHVLEARYLFCLIPCIFPWTAIGIVAAIDWIKRALSLRGKQVYFRPLITAACVVVTVSSLVHSAPQHDNGKAQQRLVGEVLLHQPQRPLRIAGLESLRRVGYYSDAEYRLLPSDPDEAYLWLKDQPLSHVVLGGKEAYKTRPLAERLKVDPRYERIEIDNHDIPDYQIFRVR